MRSIIFENLDVSMTVDEVMEQFDVTREQVHAALEFLPRASAKLRQTSVLTSQSAGSLRPRHAARAGAAGFRAAVATAEPTNEKNARESLGGCIV